MENILTTEEEQGYKLGLNLSNKEGNPCQVGMDELMVMDTTMRNTFPETYTKLDQEVEKNNFLGGQGKIGFTTPMVRYLEAGQDFFVKAGICVFAFREREVEIKDGAKEKMLFRVPIIFHRDKHGLSDEEIQKLQGLAEKSECKYKEAD